MSDDTTHSADTIKIPEIESEPGSQGYITRPIRRPLSVANMLANHLDWLQYDLNALTENFTAYQTRTAVMLAALKEQSRYTWFALVCVALLLLVNALLMGWLIYLMGSVIGHIK